MIGVLSRWLKIYENEVGLFFGMATLLFFINASGIVLTNFVDTAFLKRFGVEYLPIMTAVNAIVTFFLLGSMGGLIKRIRGDRLVYLSMLIAGISIGVLRLVVPYDFDMLYPILYILKTQFSVLLLYLFWNLANDLFNTRQSKRLFPLITTGGIIGSMAGSFGTPILAKLVSTDNLLLLFATFSIAGAFSAQQLGSNWRGSTTKESEIPEKKKHTMMQEFAKVVPLLKNSPLAQILLLLTLVPNIVIPIVNYQFSFVVDEAFPTEEGILSFFGYFRGAQYIIALILSLFVGRLYGRFGLPVALMFHPFNYMIAFGAYLLQFNIFSAVYAGVSAGVIRTTINNPAIAALYGLMLPKERSVLRPFLRGTVIRVGILLGSALLWFGNMIMHPRYMSILAIGFVLIWIGATLMLKKNYAKILLALLRGQLPDFSHMEKDDIKNLFKGVDVGPVLLERFKSAEGEEAIWYADVLRTTEQEELDDAILERLPHVDDEMKLRLLPLLSNDAGEKVVGVFKEIVDPTKPELMVPLAHTVKRVFSQIPASTESEIFNLAKNPEVKICFTGWMRRDEPEAYKKLIESWINSDSLSERRAAMLGIGDGMRTEYIDKVKQMLGSEQDHCIVGISIQTLPKIDPKNAPNTIASFIKHRHEGVRLSVVEALVPDNELSVNTLITALGDSDNRVRKQAVTRLEDIHHELLPLLEAALGLHSRRVRDGLFEVVRALDVKEVEGYRFCVGQLKIAYTSLMRVEMLNSAPKSPAQELLQTHLDELRMQRVENVVRDLSARDTTGRFASILKGLLSGGERERGDSLEALDALLDKKLKRILLPMLENESKTDMISAGRRYLGEASIFSQSEESHLDGLLQEPNSTTLMLTLRVINEWGKVDAHRQRLELLSETGSECVAKFALILLDKSEEVNMSDQMELPERILHMRKVDLFQDLPVNELAAVALVATEIATPSDTVMLTTNCHCTGLYIMVSGEVSVEQPTEEGHSAKKYATWKAGESFGMAALFQDMKLHMAIRTTIESVFLRIEREEFHAIIREYPEIALRVCQVLSGRMGQLLEQLNNMNQGAETAK